MFGIKKYIYEVKEHPEFETEFVLKFSKKNNQEIEECLQELNKINHREVCFRFSSETRVDSIPQSNHLNDSSNPKRLNNPNDEFNKKSEKWSLYWKKSQGDSKALLAHPAETEWTGTVMLSQTLLEEVLEKVKDQESFCLHEITRLSRVSNLTVRLEFNDR